MKKRAVIFDLDNTLYNFDRTHALGLDAAAAYCSEQLQMEPAYMKRRLAQVMDELVDEMGWKAAATHNRLIRFQRLLQEEGFPIFPHAGRMYDLYWNTLIDASVPEKGLIDFLEELKKRGYLILCGTNMTATIQYRKIEKLGLGKYFDDMIASEEACTEKPDPEFFRFIAGKHHLQPEECVFIGDNFSLDVMGSASAGMQGILYQTPELACEHCNVGPEYPKITDYTDQTYIFSLIEG
ncbi:MAG: HAD family hydrolase [Eubacteriales bacterium]|nr:HAD family hydrolase [Eubacteriales bacterium]